MGMYSESVMQRKREPKSVRMRKALMNPLHIQREVNKRSLYEFINYFWSEISQDQFKANWHIPYLCKELEKVSERVGNNQPKAYDLIINIPPGTTKTITVSIMWPVWLWTKYPWMRFITGSYSGALALETAEKARDLIRSQKFQVMYPDIAIKEDKDTKSNYRVLAKNYHRQGKVAQETPSGNRYSTSVGGTLTGFHGHILIWDDPLNPNQSISDTERETANRWIDQTASTRKTDKEVSVTVIVMQRLHQNDVTGHILDKKKPNVKHICLPAEIQNYQHKVNPPELVKNYTDGLLDPVRMNWKVLEDMKADLGQYGYAGQMGQDPTPPSGGMFQVDHFMKIEYMIPEAHIEQVVRYWDKAGTKEKFDLKGKAKGGAYTVGVKMAKLKGNRWVVMDVVRGRWESNEREQIILSTAQADGQNVRIYHEQEPGSGGKESAQATTRNLAGFTVQSDLPTGDKIYRADPYSVQVNDGNVMLLKGDWNAEFIDEHRFFPFSTYKDQVDASAGAFNKLIQKKQVKTNVGR